MRARLLAPLLLALAACAPGQDNPTQLKDLRVIGMSFEPPDVLLPSCNQQLFASLAYSAADGGVPSLDPRVMQALAQEAAVPLDFKALVVDPKGNGRSLRYTLTACSDTADLTCTRPGQFVELAHGDAPGGELPARVNLGALLLPDATPLLLSVIQHDPYKGLGGIRVPVTLHVSASDTGEDIYAQKLMVFTCQFFPTMEANHTPHLPGLTLDGGAWDPGTPLQLSGAGPFGIDPLDFTALEERYVVPSLSLQPVDEQESWKIAWHTTSGFMDSYETGGTSLDGVTERHHNQWNPDPQATGPVDVDFYFVVRDGRGGQSWEKRQAHWQP